MDANDLYFHQDGAPSHILRLNMDTLRAQSNGWIVFSRGLLNQRFTQTNQQRSGSSKTTQRTIVVIPAEILQQIIKNLLKRVRRYANGIERKLLVLIDFYRSVSLSHSLLSIHNLELLRHIPIIPLVSVFSRLSQLLLGWSWWSFLFAIEIYQAVIF